MMNERIKHIWDQAAKLEPDPSWEGQTKFMEKFAELIVKECCDVAVKFHLAHPYSVEYQIKKHFGVEE